MKIPQILTLILIFHNILFLYKKKLRILLLEAFINYSYCWGGRPDSNRRHSEPQSDALTN